MPAGGNETWFLRFKRVIPYNSCYLPKHSDEIEAEALNPVTMWLEYRWVFVRRFYGSEFAQKLFIMVWNWIYALNDIRGTTYYELQDEFVRYVFGMEPIYWFRTFRASTSVIYWDNSLQGVVSYDTLQALSKMVGIFGPTAAVFGREFEDFLINEQEAVTISIERMEQSIRNSSGALSKAMIDSVDAQGVTQNRESHERGQSSTKWVAKTT